MTTTCMHGRLVGLPDTNDPRECQTCDYCRGCGRVVCFEGEVCVNGHVWGEEEDNA